MSRRTSSDLSARARRLAAREHIPYTAALAALRTARSREGGPAPDSAVAASGLPGLARLLGALVPGTLTVLAGRTMSGTTALLLGIARHHASHGRPVLLAELQSNQRQTTQNLLAAEAGQDLDLTAARVPDAQAVTAAAGRLRTWPLRLITPDGTNTVRRLRAEAAASGPGLLLVDTLSLAAGLESSPPRPGQSAAELTALAQELGVPALATDHLVPGGSNDGPPCTRGLRDPAVLQHAHRLVLLHRSARTGPVPGRPDTVALHAVRPNGTGTGTATVLFQPEYHRMVAFDAAARGEPSH